MRTRWVISDPHFGHANFLTFRDEQGKQIRPFTTVEQMDDCIVTNWNAVVKPEDRIYILGDIAINRRHLSTLKRCNGHKRVILGNHDIFSIKDYVDAGVEEMHGMCVKPAGDDSRERVVMTHCPIHPDSFGRFLGNLHGHIHERPSPMGPYLNMCVEMTNYAPVAWDDAVVELRKRRGDLAFIPPDRP